MCPSAAGANFVTILSDPGGTLLVMTPHPPVVLAALEHGWTLVRTVPTHRHPGPQCQHGRRYSLERTSIFRQQVMQYEVGPDGRRFAHVTIEDSSIIRNELRFAIDDAEVLALLPQGAPVPRSVLYRDDQALRAVPYGA